MKLRTSSIAVVVGILVAAICCFVCGSISYYRGIGRETGRSSKLLAIAIYELQIAKGAAGIPVSLAHANCVATLEKIEAKDGKVISFRIEDSRVGPFGLPVRVTLLVTRQRRTGHEVLYRHSLGGFTTVYSGEK